MPDDSSRRSFFPWESGNFSGAKLTVKLPGAREIPQSVGDVLVESNSKKKENHLAPFFWGGDNILGGLQAEYAVPDDHLHPLRACHLFTHWLRLQLVDAPWHDVTKGPCKIYYQDLSSSLIFFL